LLPALILGTLCTHTHHATPRLCRCCDAQRECLRNLTTGLIPAMLETTTIIKEGHKFRGTNVLKVDEPSEVRHFNVNFKLTLEMLLQICK
jgi:hypothetical protein